MRRGVPRHGEVALEVDAHDRVPLVLGHVGEHAVAHDPRVVDDRVEPPEDLDRLADEVPGSGEVADVVAVHDRRSTRRLDLGDDLGGGPAGPAGAVQFGPDVVDDDLRALTGELQCVGTTEAARRAGHDHDPSFADAGHVGNLQSSCLEPDDDT